MTQGRKAFTLGVATAELIEELAERFYADNQTGRRGGVSGARRFYA
jgi:hypothetical protein